jgi:hypothetical protein
MARQERRQRYILYPYSSYLVYMNENGQQPSPATGEKKNTRTVIIVVAVLVALALLGYGAKYLMGMFTMGAMNAQLASEGVQVSGNPLAGGSYTITDKDGKTINVNASGEGYTMTDNQGNIYTVGADAKIPDTFPSAVPLYARAKITSTAETFENGKPTYMVTLSSSDAFPSVVSYYKESFAKNGWGIIQEMNLSAGYTMYTAQNGGWEVMAVIQEENGKETTIMLTVRSKE